MHADRVNLGHVLRDRHQLGHGSEGPPLKIHIETRDDDPDALIGELIAHLRKTGIEELRLVDPHHLDVPC